MIKPGEIQTLANRQKVKAAQVEKDYIITWVLLAIARHHYLKEMLLFKGGTALKKGYFPEYRFSEDLDFTFAGGAFLPGQLIKSFEDAFNWLFKESRIRLTIKGVTELNTGNLNFIPVILVPWEAMALRRT